MSEADESLNEEWKAQFLSKPSISVRKGIAFKYDPPSEETTTVVLTAPSGKFVDIRLPRQVISTAGQPPRLSLHESYWAFSGLSETTFYDIEEDESPGFPYTAHTKFFHDIDTKGPGIIDEGDCFLLPNGDVMEVGIWPASNQLYKEYWCEPEPLPGRSSIIKSPVIVAETIEPNKGRGIVIRIGEYIQGIFEHDTDRANRDKIIVQRWRMLSPEYLDFVQTRTGNHDGSDAQSSSSNGKETWKEDLKCKAEDSEIIPCDQLASPSTDLRVGYEFVSHGVSWRVTEFESHSR